MKLYTVGTSHEKANVQEILLRENIKQIYDHCEIIFLLNKKSVEWEPSIL